MTYRGEQIVAIPICICHDKWGNKIPTKKLCWRCGNEFDLRRANSEEWICGECVAILRGGQSLLDVYIAQHPRHYTQAPTPDEGDE